MHRYPLSKLRHELPAKRSPYRDADEHLAIRRAVQRNRDSKHYGVVDPVHISPEHNGTAI
jgi:hypothetical protein